MRIKKFEEYIKVDERILGSVSSESKIDEVLEILNNIASPHLGGFSCIYEEDIENAAEEISSILDKSVEEISQILKDNISSHLGGLECISSDDFGKISNELI